MLTIKHVDDDGHETLIIASRVSYDAKSQTLTGYFDGGTAAVNYGSGRAYVMNENGKTVGAYNLNQKQKETHHD